MSIGQIFVCILSLSLSGALTGLLLIIIHPVTGRFFSKRWNYYIWLLVIARLVIPIYFESPYSFAAIQTTDARSYQSFSGSKKPSDLGEISVQKELPSTQETELSQSEKQTISADWRMILGILWLVGAGISLSVKLKNYLYFSSGIKKDCIAVCDDRINHMAEELMQRLSMRKKPALYVNENVSVPITVGLVRPVIILPKEDWLLKDLQMVLHHELLHVKRRDLWYKWAFQLLLCIHWFNPVLYLIGIKLNIDCELSCDEAVLTALSQEGKKAYGNVLINTAGKNVKLRKNIPSTTLLERKEDLKVRLKGILHYKKTGGLRAVISVCLAGILLLLSACGSMQTEPDAMPVRLSMDRGDEYSSSWDEAAAEYVSFWDTLGAALENLTDTGLDDFLNKPVLADKLSAAWKAYEDDSLIAGKDINDQWHMNSYSGGGQRIKCDGMYLNGTASVRIVNVRKDVSLEVDSAFEILDGQFKLVHVNPDGVVTVINETGKNDSFTVNMKAGRNVIKFIGQGAKVKNLLVEHPSLQGNDFEAVYYSEKDEQSEIMTAEIKKGKVDKDQLMELLYYLDEETVSEAFALLLEQGTSLTDEELTDLIIYSNPDLSALYLGEAIKSGKIDHLGDHIIINIAPYIGGDGLKDLLLAADGKFSGDTVYACAPYLGSEGLRDVLLSMDDISFELISDCAPYLGSSSLEKVLEKYLGEGGELTFSQFDQLSPYLGSNAAKRLDALRPLRPLKSMN